MLFDRFVGFAYLYTVDMPRQIRIVCLHNVSVLCFVNNGLADKTSTLGYVKTRQGVLHKTYRVTSFVFVVNFTERWDMNSDHNVVA